MTVMCNDKQRENYHPALPCKGSFTLTLGYGPNGAAPPVFAGGAKCSSVANKVV